MDDTDKPEFANLIASMVAGMGREASAPMLSGYWLGLRDLDLAAVRVAVERAVQTARFPPAPVELREMAGAVTDATRATIAWDAVRRSISRVGVYRSVEFDDPMVNATIRNLGGWERICNLPSEELEKWYRRDFEKTYLTLRAFDALAPEAGRHLPGILEKTAGGYAVEPPVRVAVLPLKQLSATERKELEPWNPSRSP